MSIKNFVFFLLLCLSGCAERKIDLEVYYPGDKLVLWGKLQAGEPIRIQVTRTFEPIGEIPENLAVSNAVVEIYKNGVKYSTLSKSDNEFGVYISDSLVQPGATYVVRVSAATLPIAESDPVKVPASTPDIRIVRERGITGQINHETPQDLINFYFSDNQGNVNEFFTFKFVAYYPKDTVSANPYGSADNIIANEEDCHTWSEESSLVYDAVANITFYRSSKVFWMAGQCLPKTKLPLKFFIETGKSRGNGDTTWAKKITLRIGSVTRTSFDYARIENEQPEGVDHLIYPPKRALSNVRNGYGLIFAANEKTIEL